MPKSVVLREGEILVEGFVVGVECDTLAKREFLSVGGISWVEDVRHELGGIEAVVWSGSMGSGSSVKEGALLVPSCIVGRLSCWLRGLET